MTTTGRGSGRGRWGGAGVIVPFAAITTKSIIHLYKLKAKNSPINDKHVVKCCHGHCCSPVRAATGAASAVVVVVVAVLVDIFISKLILIDYILCATVQQQQQLDRATLFRGLDILNYHFIYNMPASFLSAAGSHFRFGNNVILLLVDFVYRGRELLGTKCH